MIIHPPVLLAELIIGSIFVGIGICCVIDQVYLLARYLIEKSKQARFLKMRQEHPELQAQYRDLAQRAERLYHSEIPTLPPAPQMDQVSRPIADWFKSAYQKISLRRAKHRYALEQQRENNERFARRRQELSQKGRAPARLDELD
jgi:hypothetical protein